MDGMVENRLGSVHNDKGHSTTFYQLENHISGTANNKSRAPQAGTLYAQFYLTICNLLIALLNEDQTSSMNQHYIIQQSVYQLSI